MLKLINKIFGLMVLGMFLYFIAQYIFGIFGLFTLLQEPFMEGMGLARLGFIALAFLITIALIKYIRPKQFISEFFKIWKGNFAKQDIQKMNNESIKTLSNPQPYLMFILVGLALIYSAFDNKTDYHSSYLFRFISGLFITLTFIFIWFGKKRIINSITKRSKKKAQF